MAMAQCGTLQRKHANFHLISSQFYVEVAIIISMFYKFYNMLTIAQLLCSRAQILTPGCLSPWVLLMLLYCS